MTEKVEQTQVPKLFPVSEGARRVGLEEIGNNPAYAYAHEFGVIGTENPHLQEYFIFMSDQKSLVSVPQQYLEGAVFAHRIVRVNSALAGAKIPTVSRAEIASHGRDMTEKLKKERDVESVQRQKYEALLKDDPELGKALVEMIKYRASNSDFILGVLDLHTLLRKALESEKLREMFKGNGFSIGIPREEN